MKTLRANRKWKTKVGVGLSLVVHQIKLNVLGSDKPAYCKIINTILTRFCIGIAAIID